MRNVWWIALTAVVLAVGSRNAKAQEPANQPAPPAATTNPPTAMLPPTAPVATLAPYGALLSGPYANCCSPGSSCAATQSGTDVTIHVWKRGWSKAANAGCATACASGCSTCDSGEDCGKRQQKVARFLDWLIYVPLDRGKTKCCGCQSEPPPAWAFFPCEGRSRCQTCAASSPPVYYAKPAGATTSNQVPTGTPAPAGNQVIETAYPPITVAKPIDPASLAPLPTLAPPSLALPTSQRTVAPTMPVLDPSQFRRAPVNGN
jgi:hypothetical protein